MGVFKRHQGGIPVEEFGGGGLSLGKIDQQVGEEARVGFLKTDLVVVEEVVIEKVQCGWRVDGER